jgi:hypothetical protein
MGIVDFDEETAVTIIATTFHDKATAYAQNYRCSFNPTGKIVGESGFALANFREYEIMPAQGNLSK